jgi:aminodeoxyfutalosine deaminase
MARMAERIQEWPKAELHLHLEGSAEPDTLVEIDPSISAETVREKYSYVDFAGFIDAYVWVSRKLTEPRHYALLTRRLLERLHEQNVRYVEITISVGVILWKQQDFAAIFEAIRQEAANSPVEVRWVFDAVRQFGADPAARVAELAIRHADDGVVAFGIGGDEVRGPAAWFCEIFREVCRHGLALVPHAGETDGPDSVWSCVRMGANRIGHGIRAADDPALLRYLADHRIPLEICISSNICTGAVRSLADHPVRRIFEAGVPVVLNTDDPAMFHTSLTREYEIARDHFGFTVDELRQIAQNAFTYKCER